MYEGRLTDFCATDWNIYRIYWDGSVTRPYTLNKRPEQQGRMVYVWCEQDKTAEGSWRAEVIGVDISPLMAQWVREALTDGDS